MSILVFASGTISTFALSLVVGVIVGTYSSIFVASPILLAWHDRDLRKTHEAVTGGSSSVVAVSIGSSRSKAPQPEPVKQTADEIADATEKRAKTKAKKKKKKK